MTGCTVEHNGVAYIDGERIKTGTKFYTPILTPAMEILKKYDYKFTVPTVQSFNRSLKIIAELIGLKKPLTSHIARHSYIFLFTRNKKLTRNKLLDR